MSRRARWLSVPGLVVLVGLLLTADRLAPEPFSDPVPSPPAAVTPVGGLWACAVGDGRDGSGLTLVAARPPGTGGAPGAAELAVVGDGVRASSLVPEVFPGAHARRTPAAGAQDALVLRWARGPVTAWREWQVTTADGLAAGLVAGPCPDPFATEVVVPGLMTVGSQRALLRFVNPFPTDATVAVRFLTPAGPEAPLALRNLTVPARDTLEVAVEDHLPEQPDLAAIVEVSAGRVAVEGLQSVTSDIGEVDGLSLLAAAPTAETWTLPWVEDADDRDPWLWIANPGQRTATVELSFQTTRGGDLPIGLTEVTVPPDSLRRVDLRGTLPGDAVASATALTARSDAAPVAVAAVNERRDGATSLSVSLGAPRTDRKWVVSGGATADRDERLVLINPGSEPALVDVVLFNGSIGLDPAPLQQLALPPGASRVVDLEPHLGVVGGWSAFVTAAEGELVVGRVGDRREDGGDLVVSVGQPAAGWAAATSPLAGRWQQGLVGRLGTALGLSVSEDQRGSDSEPDPPSG